MSAKLPAENPGIRGGFIPDPLSNRYDGDVVRGRHGKPVRKLAQKSARNLMRKTPREADYSDPNAAIDPESSAWHHKMNGEIQPPAALFFAFSGGERAGGASGLSGGFPCCS